jgi:AraC family transcriptional regulator, arabinose operon regulatory protein
MMRLDSAKLPPCREEQTQAASAAATLPSTKALCAANTALGPGADPAGNAKDHVYLLPHGVIYTSPWFITESAACSPACILLSAQRERFEVSVGPESHLNSALAFRPRQQVGVRAENCALVCVLVHPTHPEYRRFRAIRAPGWQSLDRDGFNTANQLLHSACQGQLGIQGAQHLLEMVVDITARYLPRIRSQDPRYQRLLQLLQENPNCQLGELAEALHVAPERMHSLFARAVGLPWRSFQLWQKVRAVGVEMGSRRSLSEIAIQAGFSDSAHLSKTWHQFFGAAPSKFFNHRLVQVHYGQCSRRVVRHAGIERGTPDRHLCPHCGSVL